MIGETAILLRLRWLVVVLLGLLWTTIGGAASLAERDHFGPSSLAPKTPLALPAPNPVRTAPDSAFFWSGRTGGVGGERIAADIAGGQGGTPLEMMIQRQGISMPAWNAADPTSVAARQRISAQYGEGVSGHVRAVVGTEPRPGNFGKRSNSQL